MDDGTETHFEIGSNTSAFIKAVSSGKRRSGLIHSLFVGDNDRPIPEATDM